MPKSSPRSASRSPPHRRNVPRAGRRAGVERPSGDPADRTVGTGRGPGQGPARRPAARRTARRPPGRGTAHRGERQDRGRPRHPDRGRVDGRGGRRGPGPLPAHRRLRRTPRRGPRPLLVARLAPLHGGRQRPPPPGTALRRVRGREAVRPRTAPAREAGPEGPGPRPGPAQRRGRHPGPRLQPRLHPAVEQSGDRPCGAGRQRHTLGGGFGPAAGLLDHRGRPGRRPAPLQRGDGPYADAPRVGGGLLAVQAALPHAGRTPRRGTGVQAPRAPLSAIVCDFFHWTHLGDWKFDPAEWPDPAAMVRELDELG